MRDDSEALPEDMIAMEQVAQRLWQQATNGSDQGWQALSVLAKQAWRSRARMEGMIWRRMSVSRMRHVEQQLSVERVAAIMWQRGNDAYPAVKTHLAWLALPEDEFRYWCERAEKAIETWRRATARHVEHRSTSPKLGWEFRSRKITRDWRFEQERMAPDKRRTLEA